MKCPYCWKPINILMQASPAKPGDNGFIEDGAVNICSGCNRMSILINNGRHCRRPTPAEAADMAAAQRELSRMAPNSITPDKVQDAFQQILAASKETKH